MVCERTECFVNNLNALWTNWMLCELIKCFVNKLNALWTTRMLNEQSEKIKYVLDKHGINNQLCEVLFLSHCETEETSWMSKEILK